MKSTTLAILAALAIGAGNATAGELEWQLDRIEQEIHQQRVDEDIRYQQWQNDQWRAEQDYKRAQRQYEHDHRLDWLDDINN